MKCIKRILVSMVNINNDGNKFKSSARHYSFQMFGDCISRSGQFQMQSAVMEEKEEKRTTNRRGVEGEEATSPLRNILRNFSLYLKPKIRRKMHCFHWTHHNTRLTLRMQLN